MDQFLVPSDPRLSWRVLFHHTRREIVKPLRCNKPTYPFFWARNAIYNGLKSLGISTGDTILVPSYHCAVVVEPILSCGARVRFYDIRRDGLLNFDDLYAKIDERTRAVVAIHYFGFPQPIRKLQQLCRAHDLYLIEDCAHVLRGEAEGSELGTFGDISVFSWRKLLPLYDGGHLILNNPGLRADIALDNHSFVTSLKAVKNIFEKVINDSEIEVLKSIQQIFLLPWILTRRLLATKGGEQKSLGIGNYGLDFNPALAHLRMTAASKFLLQKLEIKDIIESRRRNYLSLLERIKSLPGIAPLFPHLPEGVCPWVFPLLIDGRDNLHHELRANGIPAVTWGGVIHPSLQVQEFPDADYLYRRLIMLPIHQSMDEPALKTMAETLGRVLQASSNL